MFLRIQFRKVDLKGISNDTSVDVAARAYALSHLVGYQTAGARARLCVKRKKC